MMDHLELQRAIPAYVASRIGENERRVLEAHLATCRDCQELVACCEELGQEVRRDAGLAWAEHPDPLHVKAHVEGERRAVEVARHLEICDACALEASGWSEKTRAASAGWRARAASWLAPRPLAAGALLGAAACLALVLALPRGGSVTPGPSSFDGSAPLLLLDEAPRNGSAAATVRVGADQPYIPMGVRVNLPPAVSDRDRFLFSVRSPDGSVSWKQELSVEEIRAEQARSWVVGFLVPSRPLPPDRYVLVVAPSDDGTAPVLEVPFEVIRFR